MKLSLIGLLQAVGVVVYITLIGGVMRYLEGQFDGGPDFLVIILILSLLVFSAAITGAIVFGYPLHLVIDRKIKDALKVFGYTIFYFWIAILIIISTLLF